jgi:hypothetical protein
MTEVISESQFDAAYDKFGDELTHQILCSRRRTEIYLASRSQGTSPRMALMFACQSHPELRTGKQWFAHNKPFWKEYDAKVTKKVTENCAKNGRPLGRNDDYIPWLAKFPGDPDAVISGHGSPREQIKAAHAKLLAHQEAKSRQPAVPLREDYIQEKFDALYEEHPELRRAPPKEKRKIRNQIIRKHAFRGEELQLQE